MKKILLLLLLLLLPGEALAQQPICANPAGQWLSCSTQGLGNAGYPAGATPIAVSITATTGGITALLPNVANQYTYACGFSVSPGSATAAITLLVTLLNIAGTFTWAVGAPVTAAGTTGATLTVLFTPCLRSNVVNQQVGVVVGALGAGGVNQAATIWGYQQ
jgi:hypothetical protein